MAEAKYELYVFDLDGTLIDSSPGILKTIRYTLNLFNKYIPEDDVLKAFVGPPLKKSFESLSDVNANEAEEMVKAFRQEYKKGEILNANLYDGIVSLCQKLQDDGIKMAIATNKPEQFAQNLVKHFHLEGFIPVVCGADMEGMLKKADLIKKAMDFSEVTDKKKVVMVGDTSGDAIAAEECGVDFIGVTYGFGDWKSAIYPMVKLADFPREIY
ncbi:HAD hydrolase-like protein [Anaerovibrio sp. RM50]|uniref:HAD hydrolase-like protein n=1 Tax=Anaerovibrio sp. RM50 TaxID=1200557 RepID=UPI000688F8A7|nr:HAD hydrolase-like protein [Anaerovibrio sp. RM50]